MKNEKERLQEEIDEVEDEIDFYEEILWRYDRDKDYVDEESEEDCESHLNTLYNKKYYLYFCLEEYEV